MFLFVFFREGRHSNSSLAAPRRTPVHDKFTWDVIDCVQSEKLCKRSVYRSEIQQRLLLNWISPPGYVSSQSGIKKSAKVLNIGW